LLARWTDPFLFVVVLGTGILLILTGLLMVVGCGGKNPYEANSFERAFYFYEKHKYHDAVQALEIFVRQNPTDSLAAKAQYFKAVSYVEIKEYPLAIVEFQILRKDFPTSEYVEDSYFQEGVAHLEQVGQVERDITAAYDARAVFNRLLIQYPDSQHSTEAKDYLRKISDLIVLKRMKAADVYRHLGRLDAVNLVLEQTLVQETQSSLLDEVLFRLAQNAEKRYLPQDALEAYERLLNEYPESRRAGKAKSRLKKLKKAQEQ